jgi:hypothetical protein
MNSRNFDKGGRPTTPLKRAAHFLSAGFKKYFLLKTTIGAINEYDERMKRHEGRD